MFEDAVAADAQLAQACMLDANAPQPHFVADLEAVLAGRLPDAEPEPEGDDAPLRAARPAQQRSGGQRAGLAEQVKQGRWVPDESAETDLAELAAHVAFANQVVT